MFQFNGMGKSGYTCIRRTFCWLNILLWVSFLLIVVLQLFLIICFSCNFINMMNDDFSFQICGSLFLALGIWLKLSYQGYATLLPNHIFLSADTIFIIIGVLSFVVTFFGCCGSWFESRCCLILVSRDCLLLLLFTVNFQLEQNWLCLLF